MDAGLDQDEDQRGDGGIGDAQLGLQRFGVFGVAAVDPLEELLAVADILGVGVALIHQAVLLAVLPGRPVGDLVDEAHQILRIGGGLGHEVVLHLLHAVGGGLDNEIVQISKIDIQHGGAAPTGLRQLPDTYGGQTVFGVAVVALLHQHDFFALKFLLISGSHGTSPLVIPIICIDCKYYIHYI